MKVILSVALAMIVWIVGYYGHLLPFPKPTIFQYTTLTLITVVQPLAIFMTIRKNYLSSNHIKEKVKIEFTNTAIKMTGDSFYTELAWAKLYKVQEIKNWFLIYQNTFSAIIIPKRALNSNQSKELKHLLQSVPGLNLTLNSE